MRPSVARRNRRPRRGRGRLRTLGRVAVFGARLAALIPLVVIVWPERPYYIDLASHFTPHAIVMTGALGLLALGFGSRRNGAYFGMCALAGVVAVSIVAGWWSGDAASEKTESWRPVRIVAYNAYGEASRGDDELTSWLLSLDADLICVLDPPWRYPVNTERIRSVFPHEVSPQRGLAWKIVVLSRTPLKETPSIGGEENRFSFMAHRTVELTSRSGARFQFSATHPPSPRDHDSWRRSIELARENGVVARTLVDRGLPLVVAGDFNSTPLGRVHRTFARESGLRTWENVFGLGTWPSRVDPLISLPLDRAWVSDGVRIANVQIGPRLSSDHRPVVIDLRIRPDH